MAKRFKGYNLLRGGRSGRRPSPSVNYLGVTNGCTIYDIESPLYRETKQDKIVQATYPFGFAPTLHRHRLDEYKNKKGRNIFVCSMSDLFGEWIPDEWIVEVFKACEAAPQHRYLFLTKNPGRYAELNLPKGDNYWYGQTTTGHENVVINHRNNSFLSIEPLHCEIHNDSIFEGQQWVIIGAESGNRKNKVIPKREWVESIVKQCKQRNIPVFMKGSLMIQTKTNKRGITTITGIIPPENMIQEYPWGVQSE